MDDHIFSETDTNSEVDSDVEPENWKRLKQLINENDDLHSDHSDQPTTTTHTLQNTTINSESITEQDRLKLALSINKTLDEKMIEMERLFTYRLRECKEKLNEVHRSASLLNEKNKTFRYISCGRPYFRDRQNFPAPDNDDAKMAKSQMYDFSLLTPAPGWTVKDKSQMISVIHEMSIDLKKNELYAKIETLKGNNKLSKIQKRQIMAIRKEIDSVSKLPISKVALPIEQDYDWDILTKMLSRRHTAQEYQALWKLFLHPTINKNTWTNTEHAKLQQIACVYRKQDWESIARTLNSGRTGYQCFVYHQTSIDRSSTQNKWTNEEIIYLKRLVEHFKEGLYIPWGKVAAAMENRTKIQIYNKYMRLIEQRKGRFFPEEDAVILCCVQKFGTDLKRMVYYLPGRSVAQIRARHQILSKMGASTVWSVEDDKKLIELMGNLKSKLNFSTATQYFPGRDRTSIRSRYVTLLKWMEEHPNLGLEHAPRRAARRLNHGQPSQNLHEALENLKNSLVTAVQTRAKKIWFTEESMHADLDDAMVLYLANCLVKETEAESKTSAPDNEHIVSKAYLNITNLRENIIFLNACLDERTYLDSKYYKDYPALGSHSQERSLVKVKAYSRKNSSPLAKESTRDAPNVWGKPLLFESTQAICQRRYVLPPQLSNITGIKVIMACVMANCSYGDSVNINVLCSYNKLLKEQLDKLLDRFYALFTWPMILSNEPPNESSVSNTPRTDSVFIRRPTLPTTPEVTINFKSLKKFKNVDVTETIDLNEAEAKKIVIDVEENIEDTSDKNFEKLLCDTSSLEYIVPSI